MWNCGEGENVKVKCGNDSVGMYTILESISIYIHFVLVN